VQAALEGVKGVSKATVGTKTGTTAVTTVIAKNTALKAKGFGATEKKEEEPKEKKAA